MSEYKKITRRKFCLLLGGMILSTSVFARRGGSRRSRNNSEKDIPLRFRGRGLRSGQQVNGKTLNRTQLESCVIQQDKIENMETLLNKQKAKIKLASNKIQQSEKNIEIQQQFVDSYSQQSVGSFNGLINSHKKLVATYNNSLPQYNNYVKQKNEITNNFNKSCANTSYYIDDMIFVLNKLGITQ